MKTIFRFVCAGVAVNVMVLAVVEDEADRTVSRDPCLNFALIEDKGCSAAHSSSLKMNIALNDDPRLMRACVIALTNPCRLRGWCRLSGAHI